MARTLVIFDASPAQEPTAWMHKACQLAKLNLIPIDQVADEMSKDPKAQKALFASGALGEDPKLAPYYAAALDKVAGTQQRIAVHSVSWFLFHQKPAACVLDFDELENERHKAEDAGLTMAQYDQLVAEAKAKLLERAGQYLSADKILALPEKSSPAQKAELAAAFLKKLGLSG